jgi:hypothetical protein
MSRESIVGDSSWSRQFGRVKAVSGGGHRHGNIVGGGGHVGERGFDYSCFRV